MQAARELTRKKLLHQKKNTVLMAIVLAVSILFLVALPIFIESAKATRMEILNSFYGTWDVAVIPDSGMIPKESEEFQLLGISELCGRMLDQNGDWGSLVGVIPQELQSQIPLLMGRWPENDQEIVMEAEALNQLGLLYEIGQEVHFSMEELVEIPVFSEETVSEEEEILEEEWVEPEITEHTYTLVGIVQQYTGIWRIPTDTMPGVILYSKGEEESSRPVYYYEVTGVDQEDLRDAGELLVTEKDGEGADAIFILRGEAYVNTVDVELSNTHAQMDQFTWIIYAVTLVAIAAIYLMELETQHRQTILFQQIGANRKFLVTQGLVQSWYYLIMALPFGVIGGVLMAWLLLTSYRQVETAELIVVVPWETCLLSLTVLAGTVIWERWLMLLFSLRKKDIGKAADKRETILGKTSKKVILCLLLMASFFCGAYMYGEALDSIYSIEVLKDRYSYYFGSDKTTENSFLDEVDALPGVTRTISMRWVNACLYSEGAGDTEFRKLMKEYSDGKFWGGQPPNRHYFDGQDVTFTNLLEVRDRDWEWLFSYLPEIDKEAVLAGEQVVVYLKESAEDKVEIPIWGEDGMQWKEWKKEELFPEGKVNLFLEYMLQNNPILYYRYTPEVEAEIGGYLYLPEREDPTLWIAKGDPAILCSKAYMDQLLLAAEKPEMRSGLWGFTNRSASFLGTDKQAAELAAEYGVRFSSYRESNDAARNTEMQSLLILLFTGGCILIVLGVLFWNLYFLKIRREANTRNIFYAIGMSRRQMLWRNIGELTVIMVGAWILAQAIYAFRMWGVFDSYAYETWKWSEYALVQAALFIVFWLIGVVTIYVEGRREAEWKS